MAVEVVSDNVGDAKPAEVAPPEPAVVKNSSFREESNFLADLRDGERKALADLRAKLEEAILEGKLFKNGEEAKKKPADEAAAEAKKEEPEEKQQEEEGARKEEEEAKEEGEAKNQEAEEKAEAEEPKEETEAAAEVAAVDKDIALWGVPLLPSRGDEATDVILLKFLRARDFKVNAAFEMLEKTLLWRKEWNVDGEVAAGDGGKDALGEELKKAFYADGTDREGHPVCYNVLGVFADESVYSKAFGADEGKRKFLQWRVRAMEQDVAKLDFKPGGVASLLQVTDLKNSPGPAKKELRTAMKQVLDLFQDNYPELVARNILINVPFWYYAFSTIFYPFLTQRTKSKFVIARPAKVTETLLKYIPAEAIPVKYGGLKRDGDTEFSLDDDVEVNKLVVKANSTETIEIPAPEAETTLTWDLKVLGWEVNYKEEFVPSNEGSYTIIIRKGKKMGSQEEAMRNSFRTNEPGKVVLTIENMAYKKKNVLFRHKAKSSSAKQC